MAGSFFQVLLLLVVLVLDEATSRPYPPSPIHIHFDDDGRVFHKEGSIKLVDPIGHRDKFLPLLVSKPLKKPSKHFVSKLTDGWKALDDEKIIGPVLTSIPQHATAAGGGFNSLLEIGGDVKPVTENIEDDIKYDFRTGQHSI